MRNWMKQLNRVIVLGLMVVCLFGYLGVEADAATYGWNSDSGGYWFVYDAANNKYYTNGWHQVGSDWYYFASNGYVLTTYNSNGRAGWICEDASKNAYFYVNPTGDAGTIGKMQTGWVQTNQPWFV